MPQLPKKSGTVGISRDRLRKAREREQEGRSEVTTRSARVALNDSDTKASIKIYKAAARLEGGPRHGFVYYVDDLRQEQRAAEKMGYAMPYVETKAHCTLPGTGGMQGGVWRYKP